MDPEWITTTWRGAGMAGLSAAAIYSIVILYTRLAGLRSFSKMSSFDFAMTVAVGSLVAATALTPDPPLLQAAAALGVLYAMQLGVAFGRQRSGLVRSMVDNQPVLLMERGRMLEDAMRAEEITKGDLMAKLREANVLRLEQVRAVVLETTGDISVLHADNGADAEISDVLLEDVR